MKFFRFIIRNIQFTIIIFLNNLDIIINFILIYEV
jgi:hypothetical protein